MKTIQASEKYKASDNDITVFLAGGITNCRNWQKEVISQIEKNTHGFHDSMIVFNPRRENFPIDNKSAAIQQIQWEYEMLEKCDIFSMYFCSGESDQPICMYELGRNILRMQMRFPSDWQDRIIISVEDGYRRKQDVLIQTDFATGNKIFVNTQISPEISVGYHADNIVRAYGRCRKV